MEYKIKAMLDSYTRELEHKNKLIEQYQSKIENNTLTSIEFQMRNMYQAEESLIAKFIRDLEYLLEVTDHE
jgi:hypothetical protein